jgi:hypothetical protein
MAKAWSVGAWAADAEEAEKEAEKIPIGKNAEAFPSLGEALAVAPKKKKDKKTTMSLSELMTGNCSPLTLPVCRHAFCGGSGCLFSKELP